MSKNVNIMGNMQNVVLGQPSSRQLLLQILKHQVKMEGVTLHTHTAQHSTR